MGYLNSVKEIKKRKESLHSTPNFVNKHWKLWEILVAQAKLLKATKTKVPKNISALILTSLRYSNAADLLFHQFSWLILGKVSLVYIWRLNPFCCWICGLAIPRSESRRLAENKSNCCTEGSAFKNGILVLMNLFLTSELIRSTAFLYHCDLGSLLLSQQGPRLTAHLTS